MPDLTAIYRDKSPSLATKSTLACIHLLIVGVVLWLLLGEGIAQLDDWLGVSHQLAPPLRRWLLATAAALYFVRTLATLFVFMKRRMPWSEVVTIALWILVIDGLFAYFGGRNETPLGPLGLAGAVLVLAGSAINSGSEWQRHVWKQRPENTGRLYTGGLFRFARHVNYFGDEVLFTGWVLLTGILYLLVVPAIMAAGFVLVNIPAQDRYLEQRYGDPYRRYAQNVKRFVPFVF